MQNIANTINKIIKNNNSKFHTLSTSFIIDFKNDVVVVLFNHIPKTILL
jgi:hypothetical protein